MWRLLLLLVAVLLCAVSCGGDDDSEASPSPSTAPSSTEPDGSETQKGQNATTPADEPSTPAAEPPAVPPEPASGYFLLDLPSGEMTPLPENLALGYIFPVSPDGTMFAYNPSGPEPAQVHTANVDGSGMREIPTPGVVEALGPSWSPDGTLLVYQGRDGPLELGNLFVVDVTTEEVRQITDGLEPPNFGWWFLSPSFSPDRETILFQLPRGSNEDGWDLWSVPVVGGEPTLVRRDASMGVYAPDGGLLAYLDSPRGNDGGGWSSSLWLADADGSDPRLLVDGHGDFLRWSPDGTRIVYAGDGEIQVVDVATGETSHVVDGGTAQWLDNDTLVVSPSSLCLTC